MNRRERKRRREQDLNLALYVGGQVIYVTFATEPELQSFCRSVNAGTRSIRKVASQAGFDFYVRPCSIDAYRHNRG